MNNFNKTDLQPPANYFKEQGIKFIGSGEWKSALCPFHDDHNPSLRINIDTGSFKCMACGKRGGDVLSCGEGAGDVVERRLLTAH